MKRAIALSIFIRLSVIVLCACIVFFRYVWSARENAVPALIKHVASGNVSKVSLMLEKGTDVSIPDKKDNTPLHYAIQGGDNEKSREIISLLLANQTNPRARNSDGQSPIHFVPNIDNQEKRMRVVGDLIKHGANINERDDRGFTVLDKLVEMRDQGGIEIMLDWWGPLITQDTINNAKKYANVFGYSDIYKVLEEDIDQLGAEELDERTGLNGFMLAVIRGDQNKVNAMIRRGVNINERSRDEFGYTPLHLAVLQQNMIMIQLLLEAGVDINKKSKGIGNTPLHMVAWVSSELQRKKRLEYLLDNNANPNTQNKDGEILLHIFVRRNDKDLITFTAQNYPDKFNLRIVNKKGKTPIALAEQMDRKDLVNILQSMIE